MIKHATHMLLLVQLNPPLKGGKKHVNSSCEELVYIITNYKTSNATLNQTFHYHLLFLDNVFKSIAELAFRSKQGALVSLDAL